MLCGAHAPPFAASNCAELLHAPAELFVQNPNSFCARRHLQMHLPSSYWRLYDSSSRPVLSRVRSQSPVTAASVIRRVFPLFLCRLFSPLLSSPHRQLQSGVRPVRIVSQFTVQSLPGVRSQALSFLSSSPPRLFSPLDIHIHI